jgi:alpha/beta hydrolase fold
MTMSMSVSMSMSREPARPQRARLSLRSDLAHTTLLRGAPCGLVAAALALSACAPGTNAEGGDQSTAPTPTPTSAVVEGSFEVEPGRTLALSCTGDGSPTVIYDAGTGTSGIATLARASAIAPAIADLSKTTRVCSYDRAGIGSSDPAPQRARTVDDIVDDLHALLASAEIPGPYLLVGSSGGGGNVYHYAGRHPEDVVGIVMDDVPAPIADMPATIAPPWDSPENVEHVDYVLWEHQLAVDRLPIPSIPVAVLWATNGQSETQAEQALWLEGSSNPIEVAVQSGHDIMHGNPTAVADAIAGILAAARD